MTEAFTVSYDADADQVELEGLPTGAAGGAALTPARNLELIFDRADGHLARVVIGAEEPAGSLPVGSVSARPVSVGSVSIQSAASGSAAAGTGAAAVLTGIFGDEVLAAVDAAAGQRARQRVRLSGRHLSSALSRLARLDAARLTSPARSASPLWAAEAAELAQQGGLRVRALAEARLAVTDLADVLIDAPRNEALTRAAAAVADLADADEPEKAGQLRQGVSRSAAVLGLPGGPGGRSSAETARPREQPPPAEPATRPGLGNGPGHDPGPCADDLGLPRSLDPDMVPAGVFLPGLSPVSDLSVRPSADPDRVIVEALLRPEADRQALSRCRVRLVDPAIRRVLAVASFAAAEGSRVRAELPVPFPVAELRDTAWVEVVDDEHRPVRSERLRQLRLALRWADAALRAELSPGGLATDLTAEDWAGLAASAWERCRRYWDHAGDPARACLASMRLAALGPTAPVATAPSTWAAALGERSAPREVPFLAEALGF